MEKKVISVKIVVAIGIGAALLFVLMRFVSIPTGVPNTNLNLGIVILSIFSAIFGPLAGFLVGFIGHTLNDITRGYGIWWSWIIADAVYGLLIGLLWKYYKIEEGEFGIKQAAIFNCIQIDANLIAWVAIAPLLDILIYNEKIDKAYQQGLVAFGSNIVMVLIFGTLLAVVYSKTMIKSDSLDVK